MGDIKKIAVVVNPKKVTASSLLLKLESWLKERQIQVMDTVSSSLADTLHEASLVVCLGGDGTLLHLAHHMKGRDIPVLGVNLGSLGFLTEVKEAEVYDELQSFLAGRFQVEERLMLSCRATSKAVQREYDFCALNDIVISREGLSRILQVEVCVGNEKLTSFAGDGVIVATPTGSTAYSLSAGGAVVHPKVDAILITPICPHASALRSILVDERERITVKIEAAKESSKGLLTADGQENVEIDDSYTVEISKHSHRLKLLKSSKRGYFATLRENFKFPE